MTDIDLLGPGAFGAPRTLPSTDPTVTVAITVPDALDSFYGNCSAGVAGTGTPIEALWVNKILQQFRRVIRLSGIVLNNADDDMLWKAITTYVPPSASVSGTLTLGSPQSVSNNALTTVNVAGTLPFATVSSGVATITVAGRYSISSTMRTTVVVTSAPQITYGNPHIYLNGAEVSVAASDIYQAGNGSQSGLAASTSVSMFLNAGDLISLVALCGTQTGSGTSSQTVTTATVYFLKLA